MTAVVAGALFAALIAVFGALAGLVVERFLRSFGRLWCDSTEWELEFMASSEDAYGNLVNRCTLQLGTTL
jgi:hypothetical protein